jgi:hypothetical protein
MNDLTEKLIAALVIIPVLLAIFRGWKEMTVVAAAIGISLCFANLDKFSRFKGAGIEAELRTVVNEAYAAIGQLKELGVSLSKPIVDEMAVSGRMFQYIHLKYKLQRVATIAETLKRLGATDMEIEEACSTIYQRVTTDHINGAVRTLQKVNPGKEELFKGVLEGNIGFLDKAWLEKFIKENALVMNEETEEWIRDLDYFLSNKKLRREDKWQS